jgi:hypothetical protein
MNKEINPLVMIGVVAATLIVVIVIAVKMFGGSSSNAAHPGDGKYLPSHFTQGGGPPSQSAASKNAASK